MTTQKPKADWVEIAVDTLTQDQRSKYDTYKAQYRVMKAARTDFEQSMRVDDKPGEKTICGYNFGKLSVAIVPDDSKPKAPSKSPMSLQDYRAMKIAEGRPN